MKIKTIQTKVDALTKLNLTDLDFEGVTADGQQTKVAGDIKQICRDLNKFTRKLRDQERNYVNHKFDRQLKATFGKWVDFYNGDVNRALAAMDIAVTGLQQKPQMAESASVKKPVGRKSAPAGSVTNESKIQPVAQTATEVESKPVVKPAKISTDSAVATPTTPKPTNAPTDNQSATER